MNEEDVKQFMEDFKKSDIQKKLDLWFYALEQEGQWEEIISEMSNIATMEQLKQGKAAVSANE